MKYICRILALLTLSLGASVSMAATLIPGEVDSALYGFSFNGVNGQREAALFDFEGAGDGLTVNLMGYDIDKNSEVEVFVNDVSLTFLNTTANNALGALQFYIPESYTNVGSNTLEFRQRTPGFRWGVTDLLLTESERPLETLVLNETNTQSYGYKFNGVLSNRESAFFGFEGQGQNLTLSVTAYDVDKAREVEVLLNDQVLTYLEPTANNATGSSVVQIPAEYTIAGTNKLEFRQQVPGYVWGVTDLTLTVAAATNPMLVLGTTDSRSYGFNYNGVTLNREFALFEFESQGEDLTLTLTAFDLNNGREIQVLINGEAFAYLPATGRNQAGELMVQIPALSTVAGRNTLEFRQQSPGYLWGITNLTLSLAAETSPELALGTTNTQLYGYKYNGVTGNREFAYFRFNSQGGDLILSLSGYDIDRPTEVEVFINGQSVGFLAPTADNQTGPTIIQIPANMLIVGSNLLEFRQHTQGFIWGVTDLNIATAVASVVPELALGRLDSASYGYDFNSIRLNRESALFHFQGQGQNLTLSLDGYDIDHATEVEVFVNGKSLTHLEVTGNTRIVAMTINIPASDTVDGVNTLEFVQRTPGFRWGVRNLLLEAASGPALPTVPNLANYELVFSDEFNAPIGSGLDASKWDTGLLWGPYFPINNEEQMYIDTLGMHADFGFSPFEFTGSTLRITATPISSNLQPPVRPEEDSPLWRPRSYSEYRFNGPSDDGPGYQPEDVNYLSGMITSYESLKMTHGYVEMRAKLPPGRGLWPAFWLLTAHYVEDVPEIDVMEFLGQDVDRLYNTYHYFDIEDNWRKISTPSYLNTATDWTDDFHTFGMAWGPTEIIWYVDGVETHRITDADYTIAGQSMYILANLAVGGNWPGAPDSTTPFPATFEIDYIRAYEQRLNPQLDLANDYQLMFSDEFTGDTLDASKWNTHFLWGPYMPINNEEQYYVDALGSDNPTPQNSPFIVENGVLSIVARRADAPDSYPIPQELPDDSDPIWSEFTTFQKYQDYEPGGYTSGIITSYDSFKFVNGYAEIRAKIPAGDGLWPAFWLLNGYYVSQQPEIDIMEVRGERPNQIVHSYHRRPPGGGAFLTDSATTDNGEPTVGYADDFHTYGVRWERGRIDWYIDGAIVYTYQGDDVGYQLMYVIANLAVGGNFNFSEVDDAALPASLDIDYIRVYQAKIKN